MTDGNGGPVERGGRVLPFLRPPRAVIAYLKEPRERFWGLLRALDATGVVLQGVELDSFDHWVRQVAGGGEGAEPSTVFFPLARLEKLLVDAGSGAAPSLAEQFERRVGRSLASVLGDGGDDAPPEASGARPVAPGASDPRLSGPRGSGPRLSGPGAAPGRAGRRS